MTNKWEIPSCSHFVEDFLFSKHSSLKKKSTECEENFKNSISQTTLDHDKESSKKIENLSMAI